MGSLGWHRGSEGRPDHPLGSPLGNSLGTEGRLCAGRIRGTLLQRGGLRHNPPVSRSGSVVLSSRWALIMPSALCDAAEPPTTALATYCERWLATAGCIKLKRHDLHACERALEGDSGPGRPGRPWARLRRRRWGAWRRCSRRWRRSWCVRPVTGTRAIQDTRCPSALIVANSVVSPLVCSHWKFWPKYSEIPCGRRLSWDIRRP